MSLLILVVEDRAENRYLARYLLSNAGAQVIEAQDGLTGIESARRHQPDAIVLDIQLPEMDGYQAARILKQDPITEGIPLVACTAYAMAGDRARAKTLGFADYIEKPYDPEEFANRVLRVAREARRKPR
jgi:two-component system, cell cycle response regulator DivK